MKIALILLVCLVAISWQQEVYLNIPLVPRVNYVPYYAAHKVPVDLNSPVETSEDDENAFARSKQLQPQSRFLFGFPFNFFGNGGNGIGSGFYGNQGQGNFGQNNLNLNNNYGPTTYTRTTTFWLSTFNNATTAFLQYCIPNNAFATANQNGLTLYSTGPCARRRREAALLDEYIESLEPSEVEGFAISAVPDLPPERTFSDEPLLDSSKIDQPDDSDALTRSKRNNYNLFNTLVITVTSTYTSYSFVPSTFKKTITLGTGLLCLPSGLTIC